MKTDRTTNLNHSRQLYAHARPHAAFASQDAAPSARSTRYTCPMHPDILRDRPGRCPECGMTLTSIFEAIARAAMALRSLVAVTSALRHNRARL